MKVSDEESLLYCREKITVKGLMLHSVGCPQPKAQVFLASWNHASFGSACVHGFIDGNDGTVYQTLPWNHRDGTVVLAVREAEIIRILVWRCVNLPVSGTPVVLGLPVRIWRRQGISSENL